MNLISKIDAMRINEKKKFQEAILKTPLGPMWALADEESIYRLEFVDPSEEVPLQETSELSKPLESIARELDLYFEGKLKEFKTPLFLVGTPFQKRVWEELKKIPYGKTQSYAQTAKAIGLPSAFRAVARANGTNRIAIAIPCHRVIYADGTLGGYNSGLEKKQWLLGLEQSMKKYVFKPYNPLFPKLFENEKKRIAHHVKDALQIEHIGSTAVPGLGGKGIIDLAIAAEKMDSASNQLQSLGYELRTNGSTPERFFFRADLPDEEEKLRRYHVHLMRPSCEDWKNLLVFRDYLRNHPIEAKKYEDLKRLAVSEANEDGKTYRKLKDPFFERILKLASGQLKYTERD